MVFVTMMSFIENYQRDILKSKCSVVQMISVTIGCNDKYILFIDSCIPFQFSHLAANGTNANRPSTVKRVRTVLVWHSNMH